MILFMTIMAVDLERRLRAEEARVFAPPVVGGLVDPVEAVGVAHVHLDERTCASALT